MDALPSAYRTTRADARLTGWEHGGDPKDSAALIFETATLVPLQRMLPAAELEPYAHQFADDMVKSPVLNPALSA